MFLDSANKQNYLFLVTVVWALIKIGMIMIECWVGSVITDLVIIPFLFNLSAPVQKKERRKSFWIEASLLVVLSVVSLAVVFSQQILFKYNEYLFFYMITPFLAWSAFRFRQYGVVFVLLVVYIVPALLVWTGLGVKLFQDAHLASTLLRVHFFTGLLVPGFLVLSVVLEQWEIDGHKFIEDWKNLETECRRRTDDLLTKTTLLEKAQAIAHCGSFDHDISTDKLYWSKEMYIIFGLEPTELCHTFEHFISRVHPDDRKSVETAIRETWATGKPFRERYRVVRPNGTICWVESAAEMILDEQGKPTRAVGTLSDVSDEVAAEKVRAQLLEAERLARSDAEKANKAKDLFLATVSHELRTPLTAILSWAQILGRKQDKVESEMITRGLQRIEENAKIQGELISDLLDMSRIISGKFSFEKEDVDPITVIKQAVDSIQPLAEKKSVQIDVRFTANIEPIQADPSRMRQVIWNLLSNSIKFTPKNGKIDVVLAERDDALEISVADNGEGISPDLLPKLFNPFQQGDPSNTRKHGGLGLGLSIVKNIVDLHGGSVVAESRGLGTGAKFTIRLPRKTPDLNLNYSAVQNSGRKQRIAVSDPNVPALNLNGLKILVVDDDQCTLESFQMVLQSFGAEVLCVSSAGEALEVFDKFNPQVLVSDIGMPVEDGYGLLKKLRAQWHEKSKKPTPAIAVTAYEGPEHRKKAAEAGFQEYLSKPVDATELVKLIKEVAA